MSPTNSRKRASALLSALIMVGSVIVSAQPSAAAWRQLSYFPIHGLDATVKWGGPNASCFEYRDYTVIEKQNTDKPDIFVKAPVKCADLKDADLSQGEIFEFKGDRTYFLGMHGNLLLVDQSLVPGSRVLKIFNVSTKKQVFEGSYSQPMALDDEKIKFWVKSDKEATKDNCRDYGLKPKMIIETLSSLDLANFKLNETGKTRCEPRE